MWIIFERTLPPDAPYWPGRRWLAAIDAVGWPIATWLLLARMPGPAGVFVPTAAGILALVVLLRLRRAVWANHRYRFTTSKVVSVLAVLMFIGILAKLGVA